MRQVIILLLLITNIFTSGKVFAQNQLKQAIQGIVIDRSSGAPLPYVTITVLPSSGMRAVTGEDGKFTIERVSIGRHDLQASSIGYETTIIREVMVTSAKEIHLEIQLKENVHELDEVVITVQSKKQVEQIPQLELLECFNSAADASAYIQTSMVDLIFLDIQMPGINGIEFARMIPKQH